MKTVQSSVFEINWNGKQSSDANLDAAIRALLSEVMRSSKKSRAQIAQEMSALLGRSVTVYMLNDFTASCKGQRVAEDSQLDTRKSPVRFPAAWIHAFCEVTGDDRMQRLILSPRLRSLLQLGERQLSQCQAERQRAELIEELLKGIAGK